MTDDHKPDEQPDPIRKIMEDALNSAKDTWPKLNGAQGAQTWRHDLMTTPKGANICNVHNAAIVLKGLMWGKFRYNELDCSVEFKDTGKPIEDHNIIAIQSMVQRAALPLVTRTTIGDAIDLISRDFSFHPIKDYLDDLPPWDKENRLEWLFPYYFGGDAGALVPGEYEAAIGRMFMIGLVARVKQPGCQVDHMPVIEGPQGHRKSTACRILVGDAFFGDNVPNITQRESSQYLRGKWLIELSEMHAYDKSETASMKSFISRRIERYFARYGRTESNEPRQCCFIGTTNLSEYLKDETGGRRFWPVKSGEVNIPHLLRDRDQLFAEALFRFQQGESWWPDRDLEQRLIRPEQEARFIADSWIDDIGPWLERRAEQRVTIEMVLSQALSIAEKSKHGTQEQRRVAAILHHLGWVRGKRGAGGTRWWVPKSDA